MIAASSCRSGGDGGDGSGGAGGGGRRCLNFMSASLDSANYISLIGAAGGEWRWWCCC